MIGRCMDCGRYGNCGLSETHDWSVDHVISDALNGALAKEWTAICAEVEASA